MSQNIDNRELMNNTNEINQKEELAEKEENIEKDQNIINGKEQENNDNVKENIEKEDEIKWNGQDLSNMTVDKLKDELKNRKIEFPKNAKKKDLQDLLINSNK